VRGPAEADHRGGVVIVTWFWLNIPLALLFFACWAGIPLWLTCKRWNAEINAKHAEVAAKAVPALVPAQANPAVAEETGRPVHAGVAAPLGR
jgi:hypothetical protein